MVHTTTVGIEDCRQGEPVDVEELIDSSSIGLRQWMVIAMCGSVSMLDGFDLQAIAFAAPEIRSDWAISAAAFGPVFSAGLLGGMVGGFFMGPACDRFGPKRLLVVSIVLFGIGTLITPLVGGIVSLCCVRAITGLGLGAASPALVSILSAYSPRRLRSRIVTAAFCAQLLGAMVGSIISVSLIRRFGWPSIFTFGGLLPLILLPLIVAIIPEPLAYLVRRGAPPGKIKTALARVGKLRGALPELIVGTRIAHKTDRPVTDLFADGRAPGSILLMLTAFVGAAFYFFLANWLPIALRESGESIEQAVLGSSALNFGGLVGSVTFAWLMDRHGAYKVMALGYLVGGILVMVIALGSEPIPITMALIFAAAFFGLGAQYCLPAAYVMFYPAHLRGAGVGLGLGFARVGAVIAPLVGSYILVMGGGWSALFRFSSICALGASAIVFAAYRVEQRGKRSAAN